MSFISTIKDYRDGKLARELDESLTELVSEIEEHGKGGSLTLTLALKPNGEAAITASAKVSTKLPKRPIGDALFFTHAGNLSRKDPSQAEMFDEIAAARSKKDAE